MNEIFTRRSIRSFAQKKIEDEKITKILHAAMQAPSAGNQQPWEFLVIRDKESLSELSKYNPYAASLLEADVGIILFGNEKLMKHPTMWEQDLGAATQNLMLEATAQGLGTVWLGAAGKKERADYISSMFNLPSHILPYAVISVGYPKNENANHFVDRFDENRIHYEKY